MVPGFPGSEIRSSPPPVSNQSPWPAHFLYQYFPFISLVSFLIQDSLPHLSVFGNCLPSCLDSSDLCLLFSTYSHQLNQKEPSSCLSYNLWFPQQGFDLLSLLPTPSASRASFARCSPNMGRVLQPSSFAFGLQHTACLFLWLAYPKN